MKIAAVLSAAVLVPLAAVAATAPDTAFVALPTVPVPAPTQALVSVYKRTADGTAFVASQVVAIAKAGHKVNGKFSGHVDVVAQCVSAPNKAPVFTVQEAPSGVRASVVAASPQDNLYRVNIDVNTVVSVTRAESDNGCFITTPTTRVLSWNNTIVLSKEMEFVSEANGQTTVVKVELL